MSQFILAVTGLHHSVIYTSNDKKYFRFSGGTVAWRNHNPGNIKSGKISKRHSQIGVTTKGFAIFPDKNSGRQALLDLLKTTYYGMSIDKMMDKFAPQSENNTVRYKKFLREKTGIYDNRQIRDFTPEEFKLLYNGIEQFEGYKKGEITEIYQVTKVRKDQETGMIDSYCTNLGKWVTKKQCILFVEQKKLELEICFSRLKHIFLRTKPNSLFQDRLEHIIEKSS